MIRLSKQLWWRQRWWGEGDKKEGEDGPVEKKGGGGRRWKRWFMGKRQGEINKRVIMIKKEEERERVRRC